MDKKKPSVTGAKKFKQSKKILFVRNIPTHLYSLFKAKCAANNESMREAVSKLLRQYISGVQPIVPQLSELENHGVRAAAK